MSSAVNETRGVELARRVRVATSLVSRLKGLLGTHSLPEGEALWLQPCQSVHTFFMRYTIDVLFLNKEGRVIYTATLAPWKMSRWVRGANGVLELPAGTLNRTHTTIGNRIQLILERPS